VVARLPLELHPQARHRGDTHDLRGGALPHAWRGTAKKYSSRRNLRQSYGRSSCLPTSDDAVSDQTAQNLHPSGRRFEPCRAHRPEQYALSAKALLPTGRSPNSHKSCCEALNPPGRSPTERAQVSETWRRGGRPARSGVNEGRGGRYDDGQPLCVSVRPPSSNQGSFAQRPGPCWPGSRVGIRTAAEAPHHPPREHSSPCGRLRSRLR
jgi:hypothetical protein